MNRIHIVNLGMSGFFDRKSDILYGLYHALQHLGNNVTIGQNTFERSALNLLIGSDIICNDLDAIHSVLKNNIDYIVYEVENFNGSTINYRQNLNLDGYKEIIKNAKLTITPYFYNLRALEGITDQGKVVYAKWGFHENMVSNNIARSTKFFYDSLFFGLLKGDRISKSEVIKSRFGNRAIFIGADDPFTIRDYFISTSKFGLSLSYGKTDNFVNPFRLYHMVANGMPVIADHTEDLDGYLHLCEISTAETLIEKISGSLPTKNELVEKCRGESLAENLRGLF
jgi:hypothetical protein